MVKKDISQNQGLRPSTLGRIPRPPGEPTRLTTCQLPGPGAHSSQFLELQEAILKSQQEYENKKRWQKGILGSLAPNISILNPHEGKSEPRKEIIWV